MAALSVWRRVYIRDDWSALSTNNQTDQQLENILRSTALYHTLSILRGTSHLHRSSLSQSRALTIGPGSQRAVIAPQTTPMSPSDVVLPSVHVLPAELAARCADDTADTVEALWRDLQAENRTLRSYLEEGGLEVGKRGLEVWSGEVMRLVGDGRE
jgi:nuclear pore complex protein Nup133